jgi:hypothetical protein
MSHVRRIAVLSLVPLALIQAGCAVLAVGAVGGGAVALAHYSGKIHETFPASLEASAIATESALLDLGLPVESQRIGANHGEIDSRLGNGEPLMIDLDADPVPIPTDPAKTKIGIRIAAFGDEKLSKRIFDQISHRLNNPAPPRPNLPPSPPLPPLTARQTDEPPVAPLAKVQ